ncbi:MAG: response regulator transcription factor [Oscillospiraceae bacterium]|nr:response regulator transcription factor [Oscillospiraceae bacterium]
MFNILVAEDDASLRHLVCTFLKQNGYRPLPAENGEQALELLDSVQADLIITDVMMPGVDGFSLARQIREANMDVPILVITAREGISDKQIGFSLGVDDYMVKPIDMAELVLRVGALLRRAKIAHEHLLEIGGASLDYNALTVTITDKDGVIKSETPPKKEFYLLFKLLSYPNVIFTRRQLLDELWGMEKDVDERTVDVHIRRLRERYENSRDFSIVTIRGLGYKAIRS